jgi:DNA gyrase subunit B
MAKMPDEYDERDIKLLQPREHVRLRPGMYIGGTDKRALHNLIYEVLDHSIDEVFAGRCDHIEIILMPDSRICIHDNSPGVEVDTLQSLMTEGSPDDFSRAITHPEIYPYRVSGGLRRAGLSAVNGLSSDCILEVSRAGQLWQQSYKEGVPQTEVLRIREMEQEESTGTKITFKPDFTILDKNEFDYEMLCERTQELTFLVPQLTIVVRDERKEPHIERSFYYPYGLAAYVEFLNRGRQELHTVVVGSREIELKDKESTTDKIAVDFAFQYTDTQDYIERSFANTRPTTHGGVHLAAMLGAITTAVNRMASENYSVSLVEDETEFSTSEIKAGLTAIVSIKHQYPRFVSATTTKLYSLDVFGPVSGLVYETVLRQPPDIRKTIIEKVISNRRNGIR